MHTHTRNAPGALGPRQSLLLGDAVGMEIVCRAGRLWLTQHGDARDIVLCSGQSFEITLPSCLVMTDGGPAQFFLRAVALAPGSRARPGWLRRLANAFDPRLSGAARRGLDGRVYGRRSA